MKIAIVHDYFREFGGAERAVLAFHEIWPEAPIYTSFIDNKGLDLFAQKIEKLNLKPSWAQHFWPLKKYPGPLRFLMPFVWKSFNFNDFDIVISSSGANLSKGIKVPEDTLHLCYCHTPPHYLYGYITSLPFEKHRLLKIYGELLKFFLRYYDFQTSQKVDYFIANSQEVSKRIQKFYRRQSTIIHPPIALSTLLEGSTLIRVEPSRYFLTGGRLERFKNFDLIIKAFNQLKLSLLIYGTGRQEKSLKKIAKQNIKFLGQISDQRLISLYQNCQAFIFASQDEDLGLTPLEAQSFGKPIIAYYSGGVKETVIEGKTGLFFYKLTPQALAESIKKFQKLKFSPEICQQQAQKFSKEEFKKKVKKFVAEKWREFQKTHPDKIKRLYLFDKIPADDLKPSALIRKLESFSKSKKKHQVFYLNAQAVEVALSNPRYLKILNKAPLVTVDGWAPLLLAKLEAKKINFKNSIGDYLPDFFKMAQEKKLTFYFLGSKNKILMQAVENIKKTFPKLKILGFHHGYFNKKEETKIIKEINHLKPDFLLVGLGIPKQEIWIDKNFKNLNAKVILGIGGTFDFLSGKIPRAPLWMRNFGLEWIFRFLMEPKRLWKRYLLGFPKLGFYTLRWYLKKR